VCKKESGLQARRWCGILRNGIYSTTKRKNVDGRIMMSESENEGEGINAKTRDAVGCQAGMDVLIGESGMGLAHQTKISIRSSDPRLGDGLPGRSYHIVEIHETSRPGFVLCDVDTCRCINVVFLSVF
jgi:hypothetical protein